MKNIIWLAILAFGLASCSQDFNDWGTPQSNAQNAAVLPESSSITVAQAKATVDFTTEAIGDSIQLFTVTSGKINGSFIVQMATSGGGHYDIDADSIGRISSKDLKKAARKLGGKSKQMNTYTATVSKEIKAVTPDGTVSTRFLSDSFPLNVKWTYDQPSSTDPIYGDGFEVLPLSDGTVAIYKIYLDNESSSEITFPASVRTYDEAGDISAEYEVSQVGYGSWSPALWVDKNEENIFSTFVTKIIISEGIKIIDKGAFTNWGQNTVLQSVTLPSTLTGIVSGAFQGCDGLKEIVCNATSAPQLMADSSGWADAWFKGYTSWDYIFKNCKVYVPSEAAKNSYNTSSWSYWQEFYNAGNVIVKSE